MAGQPDREPLLSGRGVVLVDAFCDSTGLDAATVEHLMRTELADVSLWNDEELTQPMGIFDDALPSRQALVALRLQVRDDYDPKALRVRDAGSANPADDGTDDDPGPAWSTRW